MLNLDDRAHHNDDNDAVSSTVITVTAEVVSIQPALDFKCVVTKHFYTLEKKKRGGGFTGLL